MRELWSLVYFDFGFVYAILLTVSSFVDSECDLIIILYLVSELSIMWEDLCERACVLLCV